MVVVEVMMPMMVRMMMMRRMGLMLMRMIIEGLEPHVFGLYMHQWYDRTSGE